MWETCVPHCSASFLSCLVALSQLYYTFVLESAAVMKTLQGEFRSIHIQYAVKLFTTNLKLECSRIAILYSGACSSELSQSEIPYEGYVDPIIDGCGLIATWTLKDSKDKRANTHISYCFIYNKCYKYRPLTSPHILARLWIDLVARISSSGFSFNACFSIQRCDGAMRLVFVFCRWPVLTITTIDETTTVTMISMCTHLTAKTRKRSVLLQVYK
jgi:hypothetical protein